MYIDSTLQEDLHLRTASRVAARASGIETLLPACNFERQLLVLHLLPKGNAQGVSPGQKMTQHLLPAAWFTFSLTIHHGYCEHLRQLCSAWCNCCTFDVPLMYLLHDMAN